MPRDSLRKADDQYAWRMLCRFTPIVCVDDFQQLGEDVQAQVIRNLISRGVTRASLQRVTGLTAYRIRRILGEEG